MKKLVSPFTMFLFGIIVFATIMIITRKLNLNFENDLLFWFYCVLIALVITTMSISVYSMISQNRKSGKNPFTQINTQGIAIAGTMPLLEKVSTINTSGAIAVFVLVYFLIH
ncbi:hypothetical protein [Flavivirga jejuensis]|uniref:Uncharacterized protein n=1 Tax=Flavivirga jejuensis TaxID=870487 RepID=A0ABT8WLE9_9FLAO|nr:hypothetical protein [Flavivirga jejuensis]MDO5973985.1 hypothetical protein [Flavivirga jejuensis]